MEEMKGDEKVTRILRQGGSATVSRATGSGIQNKLYGRVARSGGQGKRCSH